MARQTIQNANASLYFSGSNGSMTSPVVPDITGFSFGMWIKTAVRADSTEHYVSWNTAGFTDGFGLIKNTAGIGVITLQLYNGVTIKGSVAAADQRNWMHIACTYMPDGTANIYLNGVLAQSAAVSGSISAATGQTLTFGKRSYTGSYSRYNMNNLVWHNTTTSWTAAQVLALYQSGTIPTGATAVYPLSEGAGSIAYDTSGNGNNGTITSGTWSRDTPTKTRKGVNGNMVYNGDFEIAPVVNVPQTTASRYIDGTTTGSTTSNTFGWAIPGSGVTASAGVSFDSTVKRSGSYSLKLSTLDATGTAIASQALVAGTPAGADVANIQQVLPSTSYTLTAWVKTTNAATNSVYADLREHDGARASVLTTSSSKLSGTNDWTRLSVTVTTASTTRYIAILLRNAIAGNVSDAWFDDIQLYPTTVITRSANTLARRPVDELVYNGDFEYAPAFTAAQTSSGGIDGTAGGSTASITPYIWRFSLFAAQGSARFDPSVSYSGTTSMKVSTVSVLGQASVSYGSTAAGGTPARIKVLPSTSYTVSGWVKTNNVAADSAYIEVSDYSGQMFIGTTRTTSKLSGTNDWTYLTATFTTDATARFVVVFLRNYVAGNISDAWFDNVSLKLTTPTGRSAA